MFDNQLLRSVTKWIAATVATFLTANAVDENLIRVANDHQLNSSFFYGDTSIDKNTGRSVLDSVESKMGVHRTKKSVKVLRDENEHQNLELVTRPRNRNRKSKRIHLFLEEQDLFFDGNVDIPANSDLHRAGRCLLARLKGE